MPLNVAVLPVANQSQDLTAPVLIRYFLEKRLKKGDFIINNTIDDVNQQLRQMGIRDGNQINLYNIQQIGQFLRVQGVFHATLIDFRQNPVENTTVIRAKFQFVEVMNGRMIWEKEIEFQKNGLMKIPVKVVVSTEWPEKVIRSIAKGAAGKFPSQLVKEALKSLPD